MPIPFPNLSDSVDPKLREYIRLLHSRFTEMETSIKQNNTIINNQLIKIRELESRLKALEDANKT